MRAAVFQGRGHGHRIEHVADPAPKSGEVLLKVARCGICASDVTFTGLQDSTSAFGSLVERLYQPGVVLGHEIAGEVVAIGRDVEDMRIGDRLAAMGQSGCGHCLDCLRGKPLWCKHIAVIAGGYAQFASVGAKFNVKLPSSVSFADMALVEPLAVSLHAVSVADIKPAARVMVLGAGMIGLGMAHFARTFGADRIVVVARSERAKSLALTMGADAFLTQSARLAEETTDALGGPPDVVLEAAGAPGTINQAIDIVRPYGTLVLSGMTSRSEPMEHGMAMMKELQIKYVMAYDLAEFKAVGRLIESRSAYFLPLVTDVVGLDQFPAAFESLRARSNQCKVMVDPWQ
jgi:2-desacetyl-2-hydroxyethyl bacteriochlorophyllide A dehydrogenase